MKHIAILALGLTAVCQNDETVTAYTDGTTDFTLVSIDGKSFPATATIDLSEVGRISGQAPCNRYFATQTAPYPWFAIGPVGATKMACADLASEGAFFEALGVMALAEVVGKTLILTNDTGREMVFQAP